MLVVIKNKLIFLASLLYNYSPWRGWCWPISLTAMPLEGQQWLPYGNIIWYAILQHVRYWKILPYA